MRGSREETIQSPLTVKQVNDLLQLKQQQASVVQAWESVNQAEEAVRQGRAIMMFTIITIIFVSCSTPGLRNSAESLLTTLTTQLPLSFMSSVFGMNNIEFGQNDTDWTLRKQFWHMCMLTTLLSLASFLVALFSR